MAIDYRCDRRFPNTHALHQHLRDSPRHHFCWDCRKEFSTWKLLERHYIQSHYYCQLCSIPFQTNGDLIEHYRDDHYYCARCKKVFETKVGITEHYVQSPNHHFCQRCEIHFSTERDLIEHYLDEHYYCSTCHQVFDSQYGLNQHYEKSSAHFYCGKCKRDFPSASNLNSHLNSSTHQPKNIKCPGKDCDMSFVSTAALILHFESGRCGSGIDRAKLNRLVRDLDRNHVIIDPSRLLTNGDDEVRYFASPASWNGYSYECYLCHGTYRTLHALNQHLASPKHQQKSYVCPLTTCRARFTTLSGLCQHIESQKCGVIKFRPVKNMIDNCVRRVGGLMLTSGH